MMTSSSAGPPPNSPTATASAGRNRFPPAVIRCDATSARKGSPVRTLASNAFSTRARSSSRQGRDSSGARLTTLRRYVKVCVKRNLNGQVSVRFLAGTTTLTTKSPPSPVRGFHLVRTIYRPSPPRRGVGAGGSPPPQPQLHRHRAHSARPHPRGRGGSSQGPRAARHLPGGRADPGRGDHRSGRFVTVRPHPLHPARQEGAGAVAP